MIKSCAVKSSVNASKSLKSANASFSANIPNTGGNNTSSVWRSRAWLSNEIIISAFCVEITDSILSVKPSTKLINDFILVISLALNKSLISLKINLKRPTSYSSSSNNSPSSNDHLISPSSASIWALSSSDNSNTIPKTIEKILFSWPCTKFNSKIVSKMSANKSVIAYPSAW